MSGVERVYKLPGYDGRIGVLADEFATMTGWTSARTKARGLHALEVLHLGYRSCELGCGRSHERDLGRLWNNLVGNFFRFWPHPDVELGQLYTIKDDALKNTFTMLRADQSAFFANLPRIIREMRSTPEQAAKRAASPDRLGARRLFDDWIREPLGSAVTSRTLLDALGKKASNFLSTHTASKGQYQPHLLHVVDRGGPRRPNSYWRPSVLRVLASKWVDGVTLDEQAEIDALPKAPPGLANAAPARGTQKL